MKTTFLDYYKVILGKVSFDRQLLQKEYRKAMSALSTVEAEELAHWARERGLAIETSHPISAHISANRAIV